jgi:hypothetical protein
MPDTVSPPAPASSAPASSAPASSAPASSAPASSAPAPAAAFDWKIAGFDDADLSLVTERQWKSPKDVFTSYKNLEKLTGVPPERLVKLPTDNDPAAWNDVFTKMGRPVDAKGYELPIPEGDKGEFAATAAGWFHDAGLSKSAATKIATQWNAHVVTVTKAQKEVAAATHLKETTELKGEWGDKFDANCVIVDKAAAAFGMDANQIAALKSSMGPKGAMKFLHNLGSRIAVEENQFVSGDRTPSSAFAGMTPDTAIAKIAQLKSDKNFVRMWNSTDPKQKMEANAQMSALIQIAYPGMTEIKGT